MIVDTALNHLECDPVTPPQGNLSLGSSQTKRWTTPAPFTDNGPFGTALDPKFTVQGPCCQVGCRTRKDRPPWTTSSRLSRGMQRIKEGGKQIFHSVLYAAGSFFVAAGHCAIGIGKIISGIGMLIQDHRARQDD